MFSASRSVESPHYHIWTDALHGRELARQTVNDWDRGTYVRWAVVSAWTAFEVAVGIEADDPRLGREFKRNLDVAFEKRNMQKIDWGRGIWQDVLEVLQSRNNYVHLLVPQDSLFADVSEAELAVGVLRDALTDLFSRAGVPLPQWVSDDRASGWAVGSSAFGNLTVVRAGARVDDPNAVRIAYVYKGDEIVSEILPFGSDPDPLLEKLLRDVVVPISAVRAYQGDVLVRDIPVRRRCS